MVLAPEQPWIWYGLQADKPIGDPELPHMNQETGAIAHG